MIDDSVPWKNELLRIADRLERRRSQERWTGKTSFLVERDIMVAAFAIRKLIEAHKLSDDVTTHQVAVMQHSLSGRIPDHMNYHRILDHYDLSSGAEHVLTVSEFCNQIVHSFNWTVACNESGGLEGLFFSSDRARRNFVYFAHIDLITELLLKVGYDDIVSISMHRDHNGNLIVDSIIGADTRTARYEWLMTGHGSTSEPPAVLDVDCSVLVPSDAERQRQITRTNEQ